jgi:uroporphyrinogen decarboxylase
MHSAASSPATATGADSALFLRACRGEAVPGPPPVWIMRQAGRYLPEYRAVREKVDFLTLCRTPELACEVTLQPLRRFGFDAAIVFSDIMMPLEAMGVALQFNPGPHILQPLRTVHDVQRLRLPEAQEIAPFVYDTLRLLRRELKVPLIGFAGAPLTLAAYLIEGKGSKDFSKMRAFMHAEPEAFAALLTLLAQATARYLSAQVDAGAQAVQLFDSWAGILCAEDYRRFALPAINTIMQALADRQVPRIFFAQDAAALLPCVRAVQAEVYGVDWRLDLADARTALGPNAVLQGNLDPAVLFAPAAVVAAQTQRVLHSGGDHHIFNLGHGILPETPIAAVETLLRTVRQSCR